MLFRVGHDDAARFKRCHAVIQFFTRCSVATWLQVQQSSVNAITLALPYNCMFANGHVARTWPQQLKRMPSAALLQGRGVPGMTMGDWLVHMGLDQPRGERSKAGPAPSMNAIRRRQSAMLRAAAAAPRPAGRLVGAR